MFEESFSMIELNALVEAMQQGNDLLVNEDPEFDALHSLLLQALDNALRNPEEFTAASVH